MPIKGVSEVIRLPRLGKIRLGVRQENEEGVSYPVATDHFVCPGEVRKVFGDKPAELRIMFPTEDPKQWASQYLRCYSESQRLICRGDGVAAVARIGAGSGGEPEVAELREITCHPDRCAFHLSGRCRRVMNLQFLLPDCPGFGVYQLDTGSYHSIVNVNSCLELIHGTCGRLSMIPLFLKLVEKEVEVEGKATTVRVLSLTAPYSLTAIQKYARIPPGQVLLLPAPDSEAPGDLFPFQAREPVEPVKQAAAGGKPLADLWLRVKSKVWQLDVRDEQVARWFRRNYRTDVRLSDFYLVEPPPQVTIEALDHFLKSLEHEEEHI